MKTRFLFILLMFFGYGHAQIVNVESLRRANDSSKWTGFASLSVDLTKNTNKIFNIKNRIHVQYQFEKHLVLFVNDFDFKEANKSKLVSKGTQHLRYNFRFKRRVALEVFTQSQFDEISAIDFRGLVGAGFRFKLSKSKDYQFFLGTLSMFEYEHVENDLENVIHRDFRNSTYVAFSLFPKDNISIVSTTYYQPKYSNLGDFRISNDSAIAVGVIKNLALKIGFIYLYDAFPSIGVPKEQYKLTNGLSYMF